jgi:hypothetical protein
MSDLGPLTLTAQAYQEVFGTDAGRRVLEDLAKAAAGTTDANVRAGRSDMVLRIMTMVALARNGAAPPPQVKTEELTR